MPASLAEVAERAGVSRATASRALSNTARFAPSGTTQARVRQVAEELGYYPNSVAQSLRNRRSNHVGFYSENLDVHHPFTAEVINGLLTGCAALRQDLMIHSRFSNDPEETYRALMKGNLDALVVTSDGDEPLMRRLAASEMPVISLATNVPGLPAVHVDGRTGSEMLVAHLAQRGHRRVLYHAEATGHGDADYRQTGFREAALTRGMEVAEIPAELNNGVDVLRREAVQLLTLPMEERPTAIACYSDYDAYQVLAHCRKIGLRVPEDVALVGFDGMYTLIDPVVKLTTIVAPWARAAQTAIALLMDALAGKEIPPQTILPVELFVGDTT